jgi:hypothetical protein
MTATAPRTPTCPDAASCSAASHAHCSGDWSSQGRVGRPPGGASPPAPRPTVVLNTTRHSRHSNRPESMPGSRGPVSTSAVRQNGQRGRSKYLTPGRCEAMRASSIRERPYGDVRAGGCRDAAASAGLLLARDCSEGARRRRAERTTGNAGVIRYPRFSQVTSREVTRRPPPS